ncbi:class I SAM-dependent methyltransferase [Dictyobacter alpinus]|uniref:Class I SAM-dependent methyltransferase n=1 Tax=Dictyobacter alpinus TaxID=2014873 RepID=A0A402BFT5_9CHLR|nr:class I SAM-dependent methyltransferase [Dictyobacter alpinus]GCE30281.1 class I SAM-dependent methyltransferase [Dictyobacter alpinus]
MADLNNSDAIKAWSRMPEEIIEGFGEEGDATRKHLLNPVVFSLLGEVRGKAILDAGCGQGYLCRLLAKRGASMTGVEPADGWYTYACQREEHEGLGIDYLQADLSSVPVPAEKFDYVIANMVLMDIPAYLPALRTCITALKPGGGFIISLLHPCFEEPGSAWNDKGYVETRDYFQERTVKQTYGHFVHRPLSFYLNSLIQEGCAIQQFIEPQLDQATAQQLQAQRYYYVPGYLVIYATRLAV